MTTRAAYAAPQHADLTHDGERLSRLVAHACHLCPALWRGLVAHDGRAFAIIGPAAYAPDASIVVGVLRALLADVGAPDAAGAYYAEHEPRPPAAAHWAIVYESVPSLWPAPRAA